MDFADPMVSTAHRRCSKIVRLDLEKVAIGFYGMRGTDLCRDIGTTWQNP